jgi:adenylate kinase family enzyme
MTMSKTDGATEEPALRISVVGTSGAGKTTMGRALAQLHGIPHVELDALYHGPNWTELPEPLFRQQVAAVTQSERWVIDGNYGVVRDLVWGRATLVVWLDLPRWLVMAQVIWRSLSRAITRQPLWNGNRERFSAWLDPDHPIRWAFRTHARRRQEFAAAMGPSWVRLRSRAEVQRWLASRSRQGAQGPAGGQLR